MANSISGNCGVGGAQVVLGFTATAKTTADSSGNYTFSGLAAGDYFVFPQLYDYSFSPFGTKVTISGSDITGLNFTTTPTPAPLGVWTKQGIVIPNFAFEPCVMYEGNAQILSGNVFKAWYLGTIYSAPSIYYAESYDGITWTPYHANPVIHNANSGRVFKYNGVYYGYYENGFLSYDQYTSANGVTWTKANTGVLTVGGATEWDHAQIYNMQVVQVDENGTWWAVYSGNRTSNILCTGIATSPDGVAWTKYASNPVIINFSSPNVQKINGRWYAWADGTLYSSPGAGYEFPTTFYRTSSLDLINWETPVPSLVPTLAAEVGGATGGWQFNSPALLEVNKKTYMFYGCTNAGGGATQGQIALATADVPLSTFVSVPAEGVIGNGISQVQEVHDYSFGSSGTVTLVFSEDVTAGDLLLAWCEASSIGGVPTDSASNVWFVVSPKVTAGYGSIELFAAFAQTTGPLTLTFSGLGSSASAQAVEFSGNVIGIYGFAPGAGAGSGTSASKNILATAYDLVFGCAIPAGSAHFTPANGWNPADGNYGAGYSGIFSIPNSSGIKSPSWTMSSSGSWGVIASAFRGTLPPFLFPSPEAYSVPDCRNYSIFPNSPILTQGTNIYTGQLSANKGIPSTDSRVLKPSDCRVVPNIPENSRVTSED